MAVMDVHHPDILEFIECKQEEGQIHNFNISVGVSDEFMNAVKNGTSYELRDPESGKVVDKIEASLVFDKVIEGAWRNGEPGVIFLDKVNADNPTLNIGKMTATNPCGEQPLLPYESCNLGSINLTKFVIEDSDVKSLDWDRLKEVVHVSTRFLDNVIDANNHPTDKTIEMNSLTRKIGLGLMGWADLLIRMNIPYDSDEAINLADRIGSILQDTADRYSSHLGKLKGNFPAFDKSILNIKNGGKWETMRNAWRLSIAPTGTISMISNCSSGIEPLFGIAYKKHNMSAALEGVELFYINEDLKTQLDDNIIDEENEDINLDKYLDGGGDIRSLMTDEQNKIFVESPMISPRWHVKTQAVFQKYVDSGISKTINMPNKATIEECKNSYIQSWKLGLKANALYRDGSKLSQPLSSAIIEEEDIVNEDNSTKEKTIHAAQKIAEDYVKEIIRTKRNKMPDRRKGYTQKAIVAGHKVYLRTGEYDDGSCLLYTSPSPRDATLSRMPSSA